MILKSVGNRVETIKIYTHINKIHPESTPKAIAYYKNFDGKKDSTSSKYSLLYIVRASKSLDSFYPFRIWFDPSAIDDHACELDFFPAGELLEGDRHIIFLTSLEDNLSSGHCGPCMRMSSTILDA